MTATLSLIWLCGYLPLNWNEGHAASDWSKADLVMVGRVVQVRLLEEDLKEGAAEKVRYSRIRAHEAMIQVLKVYRGDIKEGALLRIMIGSTIESSGKPLPQYTLHPDSEPVLCNTQASYDLGIGQLYYLAVNKLTDARDVYDLRSGPFSLAWITSKRQDGTTRLFVRPGKLGRGQWGEIVPFDDYLAERRRAAK
jgi:hypothetical protein